MTTSSLKKKSSSNEPRSLLRILGLFDVLARNPQGLTLAELNVALEAPKSSLLLLLRPLVAHKYLQQDSGKYELGPSMFQLSAEVLASVGIHRIMRPYIDELATQSNESVYLAAIDKDAQLVTYVDGVESKQAVRYWAPIGTTRPLYGSAAGKALLAFQDPAWRNEYLKTVKPKPLAEKIAIKKTELKKEIEEIRASRIAVNVGSLVTGAAGIAAPIVKADGTATHALLIVAPSDRLMQAVPTLQPLLARVAAEASRTLANMPGG